MKLQKQSPALGPQGRLTLQERAADGSVTPSGFMCNAHGRRGFTPACGLFRPSALRVATPACSLFRPSALG